MPNQTKGYFFSA